MKKTVVLWTLLYLCILSPVYGQDKLLGVLKTELQQQMKELQQKEYPPYYMHYRVEDRKLTYIAASFGALMTNTTQHQCSMIAQIRLGSPEFDNFRDRDMGAVAGRGGIAATQLAIDEEVGEEAIRQAIWFETCNRYRFAVDFYQQAQAEHSVKVGHGDKTPCFSKSGVERFYEAPLKPEEINVDKNEWAEKVRQISAVFNSDGRIMNGNVAFRYLVERRYFVDTEGTEVVQNLPYVSVLVSGMIKADDGMELPLSLTYFAYSPDSLPDVSKMISDTRLLVKRLQALRNAPVVEPYTGPALLSGSAAGVFFHEIFGHRIEGQRMKSEKDGQTFKKMVGQLVLPPELQVYDDPTLRYYAGNYLNGFYKYDDQGVKAQRVDVVKNGVLENFLMTRTPIEGYLYSNGHARAEGGADPVSRQSNLIVESKSSKTDSEMKQLLREEIQRQGKEYGFYFAEVTSGFTLVGRENTGAFNVTPLEVYKVYADGRPDELVRGVSLIGTPLSMFSNIICAGGNHEVFTGMCGAESGQIPVTAIAPMVLVNKVEMQRTPKKMDMLPILKRPEMIDK